MRKHSASTGIELVTSQERKVIGHLLFQLHYREIYLLLLSVHQVEFLKKTFVPPEPLNLPGELSTIYGRLIGHPKLSTIYGT
jgi:hypothetical protein